MDARCFICSCILLSGLWGEVVSAQTFRRVRLAEELEDGAHYVLAAYDMKCPDSVYVMASQETTGTGVSSRKGRRLPLDKDGRIHVDDGGTAVFELSVEGKTYAFRDMALDAWLAYSTKKSRNTTASLYTLTDEELNDYHKTFVSGDYFKSGDKRVLLTKQPIYYTSTKAAKFHLAKYEGGPNFTLYRGKAYGDTLFIYKEVEPPVLAGKEGGDWTFKGDWLADSLFALDYAQARRIDFTEIELPNGEGMADGGKMPGEYVWTYVRKGEAGRLPEGWPNVVEIDRKDEKIQGKAVTRMVGSDSCVLGPKYSFKVPEGTGIAWYRKTVGDGGWMTVGLPYAVTKVAWKDADGDTITSERLCFEKITGEDVVFHRMEADTAWQAGKAYLWRPSEPRDSVVCFYGDGTVVQAQESGVETSKGFYAMFGRYDIGADVKNVFLLDNSGTRFVRAEAGSWVASGRGYLVYDVASSRCVRLIEKELPAGVEGMETRKVGCPLPVYGTDGIKRGEICPGGHIPEEWPDGMYITPLGKMIKK